MVDIKTIRKLDSPEFKSSVTVLAILNSINKDGLHLNSLDGQKYSHKIINIHVRDISEGNNTITIMDKKSQCSETLDIKFIEKMIQEGYIKINN